MISIQAYRVSVGTFQFNFSKVRSKGSTYGKNRGNGGKNKCRLGYTLGWGIKTILLLFLLGVNVNNTYGKVCKDSCNKTNHILNGNISKRGNISLYTWNKGNSSFKNRRDDILVTLERYKPDVFTVHEANFDTLNDRGFTNYNIEAKTLGRGNSIARTIVLIKNALSFKRPYDLENPYI